MRRLAVCLGMLGMIALAPFIGQAGEAEDKAKDDDKANANPNAGKAKVDLPKVRIQESAFNPFVTVEGSKKPAPLPGSSDEKLKVSPAVSADLFKRRTARLGITGISDWESQAGSETFRHAQDSMEAAYTFDDGLARAQFKHLLNFQYQESPLGPVVRGKETSSAAVSQKFQDAGLRLGLNLRSAYHYREEGRNATPLRRETAEGMDLRFERLAFFRPKVGYEVIDVDTFAQPPGAGLDHRSRSRVEAGAGGRVFGWFNWNAGWQGWDVRDGEPGGRGSGDWERENLSFAVSTRFAPTDTALELKMQRDSGFVREMLYRETETLGASLKQLLGPRLSARVAGDTSRRIDSNAEEEIRAKTALFANYMLHHRTSISTGYELSRVEKSRPDSPATQNEERALKVEFKMKW